MRLASLDDIRAFCRDLPGVGAARWAGRGTGVAILLVRAALACHAGMATFMEAGVSASDA